MKYLVIQTDTVCYEYEVNAENKQEAIQKIQDNDGEHIPEYDEMIDRRFEAEEVI